MIRQNIFFGHSRYVATSVIDDSGDVFVLKAKDSLSQNQTLAIKCFPSVLTQEQRRLLFRACCVNVKMRHPCIVRFREVFVMPTNTCIAMDYVEGGNLHKYVMRHRMQFGGGLSECKARTIFYQVVDAIAHMHEQNAVYRQLKPEHVLLCSDEKSVKLCDFLYARFDKNACVSNVGSPHHIAPEVLTNFNADHIYDGTKADVWGCGILLYFMLYAALPFTAPDRRLPQIVRMQKLANDICMEEVQIPEAPLVSHECKNLIKRMLEKNPDDRISIQDIRANAWYRRGHYIPHVYPEALETHQSVETIMRVLGQAPIENPQLQW